MSAVRPVPVETTVSEEELLATGTSLASAPAEEVLAWAEHRFGARAVIATSFGPEDMVLVDMSRRHARSLRLLTLDTGRLPPETYELMEVVRNRYGVTVETFFPDHERLEALQSEHGHFSFRKSVDARKECCAIRKVEPLRRALAGRLAWVTGLRRDQSSNRADVSVLSVDREHGGLLKLSPLASWTARDVWNYLREHGVPYNPLHDRGYLSIGCAPCTRAVKPFEDERAGRWWWESAEHNECGIHARR
ncbi:phosphoadenylyl-sulfate reductase [Corallococcus sp. M34]|uniref:phosphoadenylyl-sulfate reductase n=1 Tax=Citreicoccus inhibens TaxID=2849499 RepID=UPI001C21FF0B|nr:phosphoadenylyl-sulfate reductase [Citreicoccus inhibens]MBU8898594.1 phosphoadenylyl-sulfate reductase [Citreicoccus inhibens]